MHFLEYINYEMLQNTEGVQIEDLYEVIRRKGVQFSRLKNTNVP